VAYLATALRAGAGRVDGALLAAAWRTAEAGDGAALDDAAELAAAWRGTAETALESLQQGAAFAAVTQAAWPDARFAAFAARHPRRLPAAVAFGAAAGFQGIPLRPALAGWLGAFAANLVSAGVRLVPLGQTDGQVATAALLPVVEAATDAALRADLDRLGTAAPMLDILSMRHETQYTRLFRS
jgi:urease accessory protein